MRLLWLPVMVLWCVAGALAAQGEGASGSKPLTPQQALAEMLAKFKKAGIHLDSKRQTVSVDAVVGHPDQPLEYLLIHRRGKSHEALFICEAKASLLNAALLTLGLENGKNARVVDKDPLPTLEQVEQGAPLVDVFHPEGKPLWITVSWRDPETGKAVEHPIGDVVIDLKTGFPVMDHRWIYLGGNMAAMYRGEPPVFMGDVEGNLISVAYMSPPNHLATMRHEHAFDDQAWWYAKIVPEAETPVTLTIHKREPALVKTRKQRIKVEWQRELERRKQLDREAGGEATKDKDGGQ